MKFDWRATAVYALLTAMALGLLGAFVGFVAERVQLISWTLLIAGLAGSSALLIYIVLRWYGTRTLERLGAPLEQVVERLRLRHTAAETEGRPLGVEDLRAAGADIGEALIGLRHYAGIIISTMLLMAVILEIVTLATAAVMYLQAQRIGEQNELLSAQNRGQDAAFLNESLTSIQAITQTIDTASRIEQRIERDFLPPFGVIEPLVRDLSGGSVHMAGYTPQVCNDEPETCNAFSIDRFFEMDDEITLSDESAPAMRGFFRLSKASEYIGYAFFSSLGNQDTAYQEDIRAGEELITEAQLVCGYEGAELLSNLWNGVSSLGFAAMGMWPVDDAATLQSGYRLSFAVESTNPSLSSADQGRANIGAFAASIGILSQTIGAGEVEGPNAAAELFGRAILELEAGLGEALAACERERRVLTEQAAALRIRRDRIALQLINEAQLTASED